MARCASSKGGGGVAYTWRGKCLGGGQAESGTRWGRAGTSGKQVTKGQELSGAQVAEG